METKQVYKAIVAVQGDMAVIGISKDSKNQQQGFMFRGIDAVYNALAPLIAKHKLCIIPRCQSRVQTERESKSGGALFSVVLDVEYDVVSGEDGSCHTARLPAEAMDSADKATNKAMSAAYKYLCLQMFCIPTENESLDADRESHEVKGQAGELLLVSKVKEITPTSNPKFVTVVTTEDKKLGTGDEVLIAIAGEVMKTGEEVRFHYVHNGRFDDLTDIERRAAAPAPAERTGPVSKPDQKALEAMSPSSGHEFASGVVTAKIATKAAGFTGWHIDQQQNDDGSQMVFASKDKAHNALMADFLKTQHKVKVEYARATKPGMANIIFGVRAAPLDNIPF